MTKTQQVIADSQIEEYRTQIAETEAEITRLEGMERDYEMRNSEKIYWKPVMQTIRELAPTDVFLTEFEQNDDEIKITGELSSDVDDTIIVYEYANKLETRGFCSRVLFEVNTDQSSEFQEDDNGEPATVIGFTMLLL